MPPENKPTPVETAACRPFLAAEIGRMRHLRAILALGAVAHASAAMALGERPTRHPFRHGALHQVGHGLLLADSYHCSRLNTNTGRLTEAMFVRVFEELASAIDRPRS